VAQIKEAYQKLQVLMPEGFHENIDLISADEVGMDADGVNHFGNVTCKALRSCEKTISKDVLKHP
jgi:hypothetical protein